MSELDEYAHGIRARPVNDRAPDGQAFPYKNAVSAFMVSSGRSSISQCPVSFKFSTVTSFATSFIYGLRMAALAFSPAIDRTGIVNFVLAVCAKSFAVSGQAAK